MDCLDVGVMPGSNPRKAKKLGRKKRGKGNKERNINYFTCLVSTVDIRGALLKSDV